jgi:2-aminoadipate transaminase
MRLNFAGVPEQDIREGVRRIGAAVHEQLGLLGSLTGPGRAAPAAGAAEDPGAGTRLADVLSLPVRERSGDERRRRDR